MLFNSQISKITSGGGIYQDQDGYLVLAEDGSTSVQVDALNVTTNGTYTAQSGHAYSPVTVNVSGGSEMMKGLIDRSIVNFDWPDGLTTIGPYAFYNCNSIRISSIPSGITSIGAYAFYRCYNFNPPSLPSGLTNIETATFQQCSSLSLTSLPSGVTSIAGTAFFGCTSLELTTLPSTLTSIGSSAFQQCKKLEHISCDGAITSLGSSAFNGTSGNPMILKSVSFPNMTLSSDMYAVFGSSSTTAACTMLEFADLGNTVGLGGYSLANCNALETLVLRRSSGICALANTSAFNNTPMAGYNGLTGTVYVPSALISTYQTATNWKTLYDAGTVTFVAIEGSDYELD